jgi:hypothetical protein
MQEAIKNRKMTRQNDVYSMQGMSINLRGSLPQIKNELEKARKAPVGQKSYYEDE